jgi:23S rRNA (cytidine1920-2'-O)/16S rRNA (cytidine1409-2'-O)-methyltransferase
MSMNSFHGRQKQARPPAAVAAEKTRPSGKVRADALLVAQHLARSRSEAQSLIKAGRVVWEGGVIAKPSLELPSDTSLQIIDSATT